jgi:hypothetical protein
VEYETVTFPADVAIPFRTTVCTYLRRVRFTPVVRDGVTRRALVVDPFTFGLEGGTWWRRQYDGEPIRRAIQFEGIDRTIAQLESLPHCR